MKLQPGVPVDRADAAAIGARHGLRVDRLEVMASGGLINTVFAISDGLILRVPRNHPAHIVQAEVEARVIPQAVAAGVRTAGLVAYDDSYDILPVPFLVVERIHGTDVEALGNDPAALDSVWTELGRDLGRLHLGIPPVPEARSSADPNLVEEVPSDPHVVLDARASDGWLTGIEAGWLHRWLDQLRDAAGVAPIRDHLVHGDVQMSNVLVGGDQRYAGLIDWGCASWRDWVVDFMPMPLFLVPAVLAGHREIGSIVGDETAEARILIGRLHTFLAVLPRGATPGHTWGETPVAWLIDLLRFFQSAPGPVWQQLAPPK